MNQLIVYHSGNIYSVEFRDEDFNLDDQLKTFDDQLEKLGSMITSEPSSQSPHFKHILTLSRQLVWDTNEKANLESDNNCVLALLKTTKGSCLIRHFGFAGGYYIKPSNNNKYYMIVSSETYAIESGIPVLKNVIVADFNHDEDEGMGAEVKGENALQALLESIEYIDGEEFNFHVNVWISDEIEGQILNTLPEHWLGDSDAKNNPDYEDK